MTLRLYGTTSGYVDIDAPSIASNNTIVMPNDSSALATLANVSSASANAISYASSASANANTRALSYATSASANADTRSLSYASSASANANALALSYASSASANADTRSLSYASSASANALTYAIAGGGLVLITRQTFSAVSSVSLDGCFTANYANYKILFRTTAASTNLNISARLRASGSDATASVYDTLQIYNTTSTGPARGLDFGRTSFFWTFTSTFSARSITAELFSPALAATTIMFNDYFQINGSVADQSINTQFHQTASAYDGISFIASAGTFSGTVHVYGYKD